MGLAMNERLLNLLKNTAADQIKNHVPYHDYKQSVAFAMIEIVNSMAGAKMTERQEINFLRKCGLWSMPVKD